MDLLTKSILVLLIVLTIFLALTAFGCGIQLLIGFYVPPEMMADPGVVGRGLAKQVGKTAPVLTPGLGNGIQLWVSYHFRVPMGKLLAIMTERAKTKSIERGSIQ